jgi:hypothetical protein
MKQGPQVGRPRREEGKRPSATRTVRLPIALWKQLKREARHEKMALNAAMHEAAKMWLSTKMTARREETASDKNVSPLPPQP